MIQTDKHSSSRSVIARMLDAVDAKIATLEEFIMATGIILMAINTIVNVISRYIFNHSIIFAEELNSTFILLVTFAGMGYAARHGRHIRMSAIYDHMPDKARKILMTVIVAVTALFMFLLAYYAVQYIYHVYSKGRIMPALGIPVYITYLWVPVGFFITGIQYALTTLKNIREKDIYLSTELKEHSAPEIEV
ncbi:TRAP transporter small permease [Reinekea sp.]|jgi:TRAP-type C4-dicarboxylate transport system permease small subunit|uniref:TRAP transporter small permease n=1 Tax=Reinekea sp. TaxID=1970455 RepID=UPI002A820690|nr:TRAP transporter small permease [Reinekea sp.]